MTVNTPLPAQEEAAVPTQTLTKSEQSRKEKLEDELARASDFERRHRERATECDAERASIEGNIGELVVDAEMNDEPSPAVVLTDRVAALRTERDVAIQATAVAYARRVDAVKALQVIEALPLHREAAAKRKEADKIDADAAVLLDALLDLQGVEYLPPQRPVLPSGVVSEPVVTPIARTVTLRKEADELDKQARGIETRQIVDAGSADGDSVEELLENVAAFNGLARKPTDAAVRAWAERAAAPLLQRIDGVGVNELYGARVRYQLRWSDGDVDGRSTASIVTVQQLVNEAWVHREDELVVERRRLVDEGVAGYTAGGAMRAGEARDKVLAALRPGWNEADRAERAALADEIRGAA